MIFHHSDQMFMPWSPRATISTRHIAEILDVSYLTVYRMITDRYIKVFRIRELEGSPFRVEYDSFIQYLEQLHHHFGLTPRWKTAISDNCINYRFPEHLLLPWNQQFSISTFKVAENFDISLKVVLNLIEDGSLMAYKLRYKTPNGTWRINYDSMITYSRSIHQRYGLKTRF